MKRPEGLAVQGKVVADIGLEPGDRLDQGQMRLRESPPHQQAGKAVVGTDIDAGGRGQRGAEQGIERAVVFLAVATAQVMRAAAVVPAIAQADVADPDQSGVGRGINEIGRNGVGGHVATFRIGGRAARRHCCTIIADPPPCRAPPQDAPARPQPQNPLCQSSRRKGPPVIGRSAGSACLRSRRTKNASTCQRQSP